MLIYVLFLQNKSKIQNIMHYTHDYCQGNIFNFKFLGFDLENHPLVAMTDKIEWDSIIDLVQTLYSIKGRNSKSIRMMIGLEISKTYYRISDQETVNMLKTNTAVMYACGFTGIPEAKEIPDSSSMTKFRNRLTPEIMYSISLLSVQPAINKLPMRRRSQVCSDTTCLPANIKYPTDVGLLGTVAKKIIKVAKDINKKGFSIILRGKKELKKKLNGFIKKNKKDKEEIIKIRKLLIDFSKRTIAKIKKVPVKLTKGYKTVIATAEEILEQQTELLKEGVKRVKNRIVSFYEKKVRSIYRGKLNATNEFGKKASLMVVGRSVIIPKPLSYENYSDTEVVESDIKCFKEIIGRQMKEYSGDRGLHSPKNHKILKELGIKDGIHYKGKKPKGATILPKQTIKRLHGARQSVEGKIGTLKTRWGCGRIPYKTDNTEVRWGFGIFLHNYKFVVAKS